MRVPLPAPLRAGKRAKGTLSDALSNRKYPVAPGQTHLSLDLPPLGAAVLVR